VAVLDDHAVLHVDPSTQAVDESSSTRLEHRVYVRQDVWWGIVIVTKSYLERNPIDSARY